MPEFRTITEVEAELAKYVPIVKQITGKDITLQRVEPLMKRLGSPEKKLKIIHVAGTSGKTSTSYYLATMLKSSGKKIGLTVSPHISSLTERIQVNGEPISEDEFCRAFSEFMEIIEGVDPEPSYFEILTGLAYWYFHKIGVDYAVIETGFGGTHDATNIAQGQDKICVITDIGYDHMQILGHTLPEIAAQKAGIIHTTNLVYMYKQPDEITSVFLQRASEIRAQLKMFNQNELEMNFATADLKKLPLYQQRNWLLARAVYEEIGMQDGLEITPNLEESLDVQIPGRMEIHQHADKTIVLDGAHNEQKMRAFVESFKLKFPGRKASVLLALKEGKEYEAVLPLLKPIAEKMIITTFDVIQDLPSKSIDPKVLQNAAIYVGIASAEVASDPEEAFRHLIESESDLIVVTGSFYLLSIIRPLILK